MSAVKFVEFDWKHLNSKPEVIDYNLLDLIQKEEQIHGADMVLVDYYKDNCNGCVMLSKALESIGPSLSIRLTVIKVKMETVGEDYFRSRSLRTVPTLEHRQTSARETLSGYHSPSNLLEWIRALT